MIKFRTKSTYSYADIKNHENVFFTDNIDGRRGIIYSGESYFYINSYAIDRPVVSWEFYTFTKTKQTLETIMLDKKDFILEIDEWIPDFATRNCIAYENKRLVFRRLKFPKRTAEAENKDYYDRVVYLNLPNTSNL
jgi:hypothetical protein